MELLHEPLDPLDLGGIPVGVDGDRDHLRRRHLDEAVAHLARHADQLGHQRGRDAPDGRDEVGLGAGLDLVEELVGDLGDAGLEAPHQARPQRLHEDVADLPVAGRVGEDQALEVGVAHRELAAGDDPAGLRRARVARRGALLRPFRQLCITVDGSLASPMAKPYPLQNSSGWLPT